MNIIPYEPPMRQAALDLALRAWEPVFPQLKAAVPGFVYGAFYPEEWQKRQLSDLGQILDNEPHTVDVAMLQDQNGSETPQLAGWVCTRIHPEDSMGEVYILAVDPQFQRRGIGHALMNHSHDRPGSRHDHDDGRNRWRPGARTRPTHLRSGRLSAVASRPLFQKPAIATQDTAPTKPYYLDRRDYTHTPKPSYRSPWSAPTPTDTSGNISYQSAPKSHHYRCTADR